MGYRKFMLILPLLVMLTAGCFEQNRPLSLDTHPVIKAAEPLSVIESSQAQMPDIPEITEPNGVLILRQALALALIHNPELRAFSWDVRISEARQLQASLRPNPELEVEVEEVAGSGERSDFDAAETTIQLSQLIELADKRAKRTKLASLEKELAQLDYQAKRLDVFTEVTKAFIEVLTAQQRLKLTEELLHLSEELADTVTKRVDAGKDSPLEKTKASIILSNITIQHQRAVQNLTFSRKQLASTWAGKEPKFESVVGQFDLLLPIPSIDKLTALTARNPNIARWTLEIDKAKAALELEKAKAISDITLSGGLQRFNETDDNTIVFGVSIPLPISDRNQGGKLQATYNLAKAREEQKAANTRIQMELAKAYHLLSNAFIEATALKDEVLPGAESAFNASRGGYNGGKFDYLMVLDAQRTFFQVRPRYIQALAAYHKAKADVERLIGQDLDSVENPLEGNVHKSK